jgi:hypothetical protein
MCLKGVGQFNLCLKRGRTIQTTLEKGQNNTNNAWKGAEQFKLLEKVHNNIHGA